MKTLSKRQKEVLDYIHAYTLEHDYPPSYREIGEHFGLSSAATVAQHVNALQTKGYLEKQWNGSRSVSLTRGAKSHITKRAKAAPASNVVELELLGKVAAGTPIDALENPESVSVPQEMIGRGKHFALEVQGDSMIEDAICDGDLLVVASRDTARPGQTVVALVDGESATVKRYRPEPGGWVSLEPANEKYKPIRVRGDQVQIRGIVAGVIRRYNVN